MKESILSNCEQNFIQKAVKENVRLDGRSLLEARPVKIYFGSQWGCCIVTLGQTRVIAQVSCEIQQPKASRPNEGMIHINVDISPLAAQHFESGRQSETAVLISRQLERCLKDSNCIDLEALCIIADKKVWNLRVDINVVNHNGNLIDCSSIAALAALSHFHRPDVTANGENIIIHPYYEKDPLPLTMYHYPICVSFITFESGDTVMDPTYIEERIGVAQLTLGINSYKELCSLHFDYLTKTHTVEDVISAVSNHAAMYVTKLVKQINAAVKSDVQARYEKTNDNTCRFKECIPVNKVNTMINDCIGIKLRKWKEVTKINDNDIYLEENDTENGCIVNSGEGAAQLIIDKLSIGEGGPNTWYTSETSEEETNDVEITAEIKSKEKIVQEIDLNDDSEEEDTEVICTSDLIQ